MSNPSDRLLQLRRSLDPDKPLTDMRLYVEVERSAAREVAQRVRIDPGDCGKYLLVGARGGGKSTELRRIAQLLAENGRFRLATVDLDASGISALNVSASELVYLCGVALLRMVAEGKERAALFDRLKKAYAGGDTERAGQLGELGAALGGLAEFATVVGTAAGALGALPAAAAPVMAAAATGIRLLPTQKVVAESSPQGRDLLDAVTRIARAVRAAGDGRHLCVLIDGLEKMNGQGAERFREVFEYTRLVVECPFTLVIAAPPSTLTSSDSAAVVGYVVTPVWGFVGESRARLTELLRLRLGDAGLPSSAFAAEHATRMIEHCGGLPRHFVHIAQEAVYSALADGRDAVEARDVEAGIRKLREHLTRGLDEGDYAVLQRVHKTQRFPMDDKAPHLFAGGRILVEPPTDDGQYPYRVHPLLVRAVERPVEP